MRVIAGEFRGRKLVEPGSAALRPATDRVKKTIFDMLQNRLSLRGARVLDLFAGTGSLGIESLSRGASSATFVETSAQSLDILRLNITSLGIEQSSVVVEKDAMEFIAEGGEQYDLIFADPPYAFSPLAELPGKILAGHLLKKGGFCIIEHPKRMIFPDTAGVKLLRKEFGQTAVTFFSLVS